VNPWCRDYPNAFIDELYSSYLSFFFNNIYRHIYLISYIKISSLYHHNISGKKCTITTSPPHHHTSPHHLTTHQHGRAEPLSNRDFYEELFKLVPMKYTRMKGPSRAEPPRHATPHHTTLHHTTPHQVRVPLHHTNLTTLRKHHFIISNFNFSPSQVGKSYNNTACILQYSEYIIVCRGAAIGIVIVLKWCKRCQILMVY
jgi:hypothetical protein